MLFDDSRSRRPSSKFICASVGRFCRLKTSKICKAGLTAGISTSQNTQGGNIVESYYGIVVKEDLVRASAPE